MVVRQGPERPLRRYQPEAHLPLLACFASCLIFLPGVGSVPAEVKCVALLLAVDQDAFDIVRIPGEIQIATG